MEGCVKKPGPTIYDDRTAVAGAHSELVEPTAGLSAVETVIRERQAEYYRALAASDKQGNSTLFIEFLLSALLQALCEASATDQVKGYWNA